MTPPTAQGGALRSQDARTRPADPTGLDGALLRIDPDTGAGLPGNPFAGSSDANHRRIAAFGFRNPFRFTVRPGTEEVWAATSAGARGRRSTAWSIPATREPTTSAGPVTKASGRQGGYDGANLNLCETLYTPGDTAVVPPYYTYSHSAKVVPGESCPSGGSSISGLSFYESGALPELLRRRALLLGLLPRLHLGDAPRRQRPSQPVDDPDLRRRRPGPGGPRDLPGRPLLREPRGARSSGFATGRATRRRRPWRPPRHRMGRRRSRSSSAPRGPPTPTMRSTPSASPGMPTPTASSTTATGRP